MTYVKHNKELRAKENQVLEENPHLTEKRT